MLSRSLFRMPPKKPISHRHISFLNVTVHINLTQRLIAPHLPILSMVQIRVIPKTMGWWYSPCANECPHRPSFSTCGDARSGGRTYHIPNYATSYANDRSKLISLKFDEDKGTSSRAVVVVVLLFLLFAAVSLSMMPLRFSQVMGAHMTSPGSSQSPEKGPGWQLDVEVSTRKDKDWKQEMSKKIYALEETEPLPNVQLEESPHAPGRRLGKDRRILNLYWDEPQPGARCLGFGTREYTARLWNLPFFSDWMEACKETEITIHEVLIPRPAHCESKWPFGGIIGHWIVNFKEEDCLAHWGNFGDKGCIKKGSKTRRFQSRLWGIKKGEDWMTICITAPAVIQETKIPKPTFCDDRGIWGVYGIWDVEDQNC